jgi:hypothetical protein
MEPTSFLKFKQWEPMLKDAIASAIEFCLRTNRSSKAHFRISEMKQPRPANLRSFNFNRNSWIWTQQTSFLCVPTIEANTEGHHRIRNRIVH